MFIIVYKLRLGKMEEKSMTEWEKAKQGYLYDANNDKEIIEARNKCADLCYEYNMCRPSDANAREKIIKEMFGSVKGSFYITQPFYCDYGFNISSGTIFTQIITARYLTGQR